jgi:hypothetical protein
MHYTFEMLTRTETERRGAQEASLHQDESKDFEEASIDLER